MMRRVGNLMASTGEFRDAQGRKAKRWLKVGVLMQDAASGRMSVKIDAIPIGPAWSGWLAVRQPGDETDTPPGSPPLDDDLPF